MTSAQADKSLVTTVTAVEGYSIRMKFKQPLLNIKLGCH